MRTAVHAMMKAPSYADSYEVLCLQAADAGRGPVLFGDSLGRARKALRPFMVGEKFPSVYLEFPLLGDPFMDVTVLYSHIARGTRIDSDAVAGMQAIIDWFTESVHDDEVCFGFELDTKNSQLPAAAIHFQPRNHLDLVAPFCEAAGDPDRAALYLAMNDRMPEGWKPSFFGMFRGRPGSPLRICGYLSNDVAKACAQDPRYLAGIFDEVGFSAYDDAMLAQVSALMAKNPKGLDYQLDVFPDGSLGETFAIDVQFGIEQPEAVIQNFESGIASQVMGLLEEWGAADARWHMGAEAAFARALNVVMEDGREARYSLTLMPQWTKARWTAGQVQKSKLYMLGGTGILE